MESDPQYIHLFPGSGLPDIPHRPTRALLVLDQLVDPEWQDLVSRWLIGIGRLYMLAWGAGCSRWDDSVDVANLDVANLEAFDYGDIPQEFDVLTTWHADEPLAECMYFAKNWATHFSVEFERTAIVHIGVQARERELLAAYAEA